MSSRHAAAAKCFNQDFDKTTWHDETFWSIRRKRDDLAMRLAEWEELRETASEIKKHVATHLDKYLDEFSNNAENNGTVVHWASDAEEFNSIVLDILRRHKVRKLVKSKSMLTEECEMNAFLCQHDIDVVETDLGERILQLLHLKPSHIVMPAIHLRRQEVGEMFRLKGISSADVTDPDDPTYLTYCARLSLRNEFMTAGAGMTGANFGIADKGEIVVCTNEGNADMSTSVPKLHIAAIGIEKIIPDYRSLAVFQRMLARSATGQPTTSYIAHFRKHRPGGEMHIILVDNGRSQRLADNEHWQTLKCIRCGACMNTCPVYRRSGGYSYTYFIPGPIGINLGMSSDPKKYSDNCSACSLCCSCDNVCPVKVNLSEQIYLWRQTLDSIGRADTMKKMMSLGMTFIYDHESLYNTGLKFAPVINHLPRPLIYNRLNAWGEGRELPSFSARSFKSQWKKGKIK